MKKASRPGEDNDVLTEEEILLKKQDELEKEEDAKGVEDISIGQFMLLRSRSVFGGNIQGSSSQNIAVLSGGGDDNAYLWYPDENNKSIE